MKPKIGFGARDLTLKRQVMIPRLPSMARLYCPSPLAGEGGPVQRGRMRGRTAINVGVS
jgi:hypothetical protein